MPVRPVVGPVGVHVVADPSMDAAHFGIACDYGLPGTDRTVITVYRMDAAGKPVFVGQFDQGNPIEFRDGRPVIDVEEVK